MKSNAKVHAKVWFW